MIKRTLETFAVWRRLVLRFDSEAYLSQNPDVAKNGMNPLIHYLRFGRHEGRCAPLNSWSFKSQHKAAQEYGKSALRGSLEISKDSPSIQGWIALMGDSTPRDAKIILPTGEVTIRAAHFRADLLDNRINEGAHAFSASVPAELFDGKLHTVRLLDAETGTELATACQTWERGPSPFDDLEGFLISSLTQPVVNTPFTENDKRVFAVMEAIANRFERHAAKLSAPPLVSVIMPVYNRKDFVGQAIESVLAQTYSHFELIVVDDGSTDGSATAIESFADPRIKFLKLDKNLGPAKARNEAFRSSRGQIIAYLDSDNTWDARYLGATVGAYAECRDSDAVISGRYIYNGDEPAASSVSFGHLNISLLENRNYLDINCLSHKRGVFGDAPPFDEALTRYLDYDLILRLVTSRRLVSCPLLLCNYYRRKAPNTLSAGKPRADDMERIYQKHYARVTNRRALEAKQPLSRNVTVVIPSYEAFDELESCISALRGQKFGGKLEVVVVDNNSGPMVRAYLKKVALELDWLTLVQNLQNYGFTYAVNQGILASALPESDIFLLNNDAVPEPAAIHNLQRAAYTLPEAGITVPQQILPAATQSLETHVPYASTGRPVDANISAHHRNVARIELFHNGGPLEVTFAPFFAAYIRRDVIEDIGLLDAEHGRHYRSDRVYCDMVRSLAGRKIYHIPDASVIHRLQRSTETLRDQDDEKAFEAMFRENRWSDEELRALGYRRATWDT